MDKRRIIRASDLPQRRLVIHPEELSLRAPFKQAFNQMLESDDTPPDNFRFRASRWTFSTPPPMKPVAKDQPDYTGVKWGRVVVLGVLDAQGRKRDHASWVVRCVCGNYEVRTSKAIRKKTDIDECCVDCARHRQLLRRRAFERTGKWPKDR